MVTIFAFESLKKHKDYSRIKNETPVKFLGHLRNAAAHGNSFNFIGSRSRKFIDPGRIEWKGKIIGKDLHGKTAYPDFFAPGDFAYLFEDISKLI